MIIIRVEREGIGRVRRRGIVVRRGRSTIVRESTIMQGRMRLVSGLVAAQCNKDAIWSNNWSLPSKVGSLNITGSNKTTRGRGF